jgi:hypothetical protein
MNDKLLTSGKTRHLTCTWVSTGDAKMPLACVWVDVETSRTASSERTASNDESGGDASVRLETGELQPRGLPGLRFGNSYHPDVVMPEYQRAVTTML